MEPTATISEIKISYQNLAKVYHPDLYAYEMLLDPTARVVYDMSLVSRRRTRTTSFGCSARSGFHPTCR